MSIIQRIDELGFSAKGHAAGAFASKTLSKIEKLLPTDVERTCETGCGKTTILFSCISKKHVVFTLDDTRQGTESSVLYYRNCPITQTGKITEVFGPTQDTVPTFKHEGQYDIILIDGPHAYPFPELEYYYLHQHLKTGGILILDDVHIPTIGRLGDFLREEAMFDFIELVECTALFRRTTAPLFNPKGDGWWQQKYNLRRVPPWVSLFVNDGGKQQSFYEIFHQQPPKKPKKVSGLRRLLSR